MKDGQYTNKFKDGERVRLVHTGEIVTIERWGYVTNMRRYSYNMVEHPATFYFESELEKGLPEASDSTEQPSEAAAEGGVS